MKVIKMKLLALLLLCALFARAQHATAYAYYTAILNLQNTEVYVFTSPRAFNYVKGSAYVFAPYEYQKAAGNVIEIKGKLIDPEWPGLYANQLTEHTGMLNYMNTQQEVLNKMREIYEIQKAKPYHDKPVTVILFDNNSGSVLSTYSISSSSVNNKTGSQGKAYQKMGGSNN